MPRTKKVVQHYYCGNIEFRIVFNEDDTYDVRLSNWGSWIHDGQKRPRNEFVIKVEGIEMSKPDTRMETFAMVAYRALFIAMGESTKQRNYILQSAELDDKGQPIIETR